MNAVGAVLSKEQKGAERFLGVKGRKCRPYERKDRSSKGDKLALTYGLSKYSHILRLNEFNNERSWRDCAEMVGLQSTIQF